MASRTAATMRLSERRCPASLAGQREVQAGRDAPRGPKERGRAEPITHATCSEDR